MDTDKLREKALAEMERVVDELVAGASASRQDMAAMERKIYGAMNGLKAKLLQAWSDEASDDSARPLCPHCGGPLRQKQHVPKTCICEGGQVKLARKRWWCNACKASFFPSRRNGNGGELSDHAGGCTRGG